MDGPKLAQNWMAFDKKRAITRRYFEQLCPSLVLYVQDYELGAFERT